MVYRGQPSLACALCRTRRLKCDQRRPSCSQCIRVNRECSGYRDPTTLRFHDQSEEVIRKAQKQSPPQKPSKSSNYSNFCSRDESASLVPAPISVPIDVSAMSFMLKCFVGTTPMGGVFPYIPHLLGTDPSPALQAAIKAIGLASMSNTRMSAELMRAARKEYSTALLATNSALQDQVQSKSDSTLTAVMLLSMYETITCRSPDLMDRWMSHVQGATKLLEMRGAQQLQTPTGLQLFSQLRIQIALGHIFYKQYAPSVVVQLSKEAAANRDSGLENIEDFFDILVQVSNLSAKIRANASRGSSFGNPAPFIQKALQLDRALVSWAMSIDPACLYTTVSTLDTKNHSVYGESYHGYPNVEIASMWNNYRLTRIIIHEIVGSIYVRLLEPGGPPEDRLMALRSIAISRQMAEDICSSVPYHFNSGDVAIGSAFRLIWPLYIASDCVGSAPKMKQWIVRTLEKIGQATGVQQALTMSQLVKGETKLEWLSGELDKMEGKT